MIESSFDKFVPSLLDRGFTYCYAHLRGGGYRGYDWYISGKMLQKKNTFDDFITCANYLFQNKITCPSKLVIDGRGAGGWRIGADINMKPESLCHLAIMGVPFLHVADTMSDACLPVTTGEYNEWGNPIKRKEKSYIESYDPVLVSSNRTSY